MALRPPALPGNVPVGRAYCSGQDYGVEQTRRESCPPPILFVISGQLDYLIQSRAVPLLHDRPVSYQLTF